MLRDGFVICTNVSQGLSRDHKTHFSVVPEQISSPSFPESKDLCINPLILLVSQIIESLLSTILE